MAAIFFNPDKGVVRSHNAPRQANPLHLGMSAAPRLHARPCLRCLSLNVGGGRGGGSPFLFVACNGLFHTHMQFDCVTDG